MQRQFSAGGLVYKKDGGQTLWLLRRPTPNPEYKGNLGWSLPKGWLDDTGGGLAPGPISRGDRKATEEELQSGALREVREEGGVIAKVVKKLTTVRTFFTDQNGEKVMKFITYYLMEFIADAPEGHDTETAEVRWVTGDMYQELAAYKSEKELIHNV